jgi:hypothetical protein
MVCSVALAMSLKGATWVVTKYTPEAAAPCVGLQGHTADTAKAEETGVIQDKATCDSCTDECTRYFTCDNAHVTCEQCMERFVNMACRPGKDMQKFFIANKGIRCSHCASESTWRFSGEELKRRFVYTS